MLANFLIHIKEVPDWILWPFIVILAAVFTAAARWVLGSGSDRT